MWSKDIEQSFHQVCTYLDICGRNGITLNPEKFQFAKDEVEFAGFCISNTDVKPSKKLLEAITTFPTPRCTTDIRSWFGLVNQVAYTFSVANQMQPFRQLLKANTPFRWTAELDSLFLESKQKIAEEIQTGVRIYDKEKPTCLITDWSRNGIGYWLLQKHCTCNIVKPFCCKTGWKVALIGSRFTHTSESRYAPIEGEALAVVDALERARYFVLGCKDLTIAVDHKPLVKILSDRSLEAIPNNRLRSLKERTLRYQFKIVHIPGMKNKASDALSRYPTGEATPLQLHDNVAPTCHSIGSQNVDTLEENIRTTSEALLCNIDSVTWDNVREATASDTSLHHLSNMIITGLPEAKQNYPPPLQEFHKLRENLYVVDGVIMYNDRVLIPPPLRQKILSTLHAAHQGITSMTSRATSSVFWPGITQDIHKLREQCDRCNRIAPSQPNKPPIKPEMPDYPFQKICADYFTYKGTNYLVIVDRYSNWPIIERAKDGAKGLITTLRKCFTTYGIPEEIATDGGTEFTSAETKRFLKNWGTNHRMSSVAYPHSNCRAEVGVKTAKRIIADNTAANGDLDTDTLQRAILQYRNTPDQSTKISPAQCIFGRPTRDLIPIWPRKYKPHKTWRETLKLREKALQKRHLKISERLHEHTRRLPPLCVGDYVRIQNQTGNFPRRWDKTGQVIEVRQYNQYLV